MANGCDGAIHAIEFLLNGDIVVGGSFEQCGNTPASNIARFSPATQSWHALGAGISNSVQALVRSGNRVYVGGQFLRAGNLSVSNLARYDFSTDTWRRRLVSTPSSTILGRCLAPRTRIARRTDV